MIYNTLMYFNCLLHLYPIFPPHTHHELMVVYMALLFLILSSQKPSEVDRAEKVWLVQGHPMSFMAASKCALRFQI